MSYDGIERRKMNDNSELMARLNTIDVNIGILNTKIENLHSKINNYKDDISDRLDKHDLALHGNGKPGIASLLATLQNEFESHSKTDQWFNRLGITTGISVIGFLIWIVLFK